MAKLLYAHRNGGLMFWRVGRLGGTFHLARRNGLPAAPKPQVWHIGRTGTLTRVRARNVAVDAAWDALPHGAAMVIGMAIAALALM